MDSLLVGFGPGTRVIGWDSVPAAYRPPVVWLIHLCFDAMECGWVVTEVGRQPWVVYRLQTTTAAATANGGVIASLSVVIIGYAVLGTATILVLRILARRWRRDDTQETAVPYGPQGHTLGQAGP